MSNFETSDLIFCTYFFSQLGTAEEYCYHVGIALRKKYLRETSLDLLRK